jgi:hypothetical protein
MFGSKYNANGNSDYTVKTPFIYVIITCTRTELSVDIRSVNKFINHKNHFMSSIVNEIMPGRFAGKLGQTLSVNGIPKLRFQKSETDPIFTMSLTVSFDIDEDIIVNDTGDKIDITEGMGDLFVSTINEDLDIDNPDEFHFSFDGTDIKLNYLSSTSPIDKGNHPR